MGRIYAATYTGTITVAGGDTDLLSLQPASNKPVRLRGFRLSQISEVGDTQEEGLRVSILRLPATFTVGSGGGVITALPTLADAADQVWSFTARANDTTVATTSGTAQILEEIGWNERNSPCDFWYPDAAFCPKVKNGEGLIIRLQTTLADDMTGCFTFWLEEE